ncbi:MAG TPA: aromatic-ring-hydroxylating dioxygenase subunit beta [Caulobacteraceae bacterium]|jgi:3-phenylpropionate/cinnamic acid dioxygenase small subunit|nr:aromatic-ring-hydroxylating dioxygenase subunit beta [Caulobacteraceae bacterium]
MPLDIADISAAKAQDSAAPADAETERSITQLIHKAARLTDDRKYMDWMELFADDSEYSAITHENLNHKGLRLFRDSGKQALHERVAYLMGVWQVPRGKTLHFVSNIEVSAGQDENAATAISNFLITRTADLEHTVLHAAGRYADALERQEGVWRFKSRLAIVDSNLLPGEFTELL